MNDNKPEWLQALEAQSWQAELIASGLAIYGSLSMGTYLDGFAEWAALRFSDRILDILYFLLLYIYTAHAVLVVSFITHLVLRILWAGILGLSSVFPGGINIESKAYPEHFKEKLKKEFPDLSQYSLELDKLCSLIFSILCAMIMVLISISIWLFIYIGLSELLINFLPEETVNYIGYGFVIFFFLVAILSGLTSAGVLKNTSFAKNYSYKINQFFSKGVYFIAYKPFNYIIQTIRTNVTSKLFFVGMFAIIIISMFIALPRFRTIVPYYKSDIFVKLNSHESYVIQNSYLDKLETKRILEPVIQSEVVKDNYLQLYIPKYKREQPLIETICGKFVWNDDLSIQKNRELRNDFKVKCANDYYTISLDNKSLKKVDYQYRRNLYNDREGYEVFINIDSLLVGSHSIQIESAYTKDGISFKRSIPFYKAD